MSARGRHIPAHQSMPPRVAVAVVGVPLAAVVALGLSNAKQEATKYDTAPISSVACAPTVPGPGPVSVSCGGSK